MAKLDRTSSGWRPLLLLALALRAAEARPTLCTLASAPRHGSEARPSLCAAEAPPSPQRHSVLLSLRGGGKRPGSGVLLAGRAAKAPGAAAPDGARGLSGDYTAIGLLMLLYTLQGIPMGLGTVVPFLLAEKGVSAMEQAVFTMVQYPFALKLLWAPLVDSLYSRRVGRRKSWILAVQPAIGVLMLYASGKMDALLSGAAPNVRALTGYFLAFYFLAATQDIAVDGLALTALSERNKELGATCNAVGQTLGFFLAYVGFVALNAKGLASLGGYMRFWAWVFIGSTAAVLLVRGKDEYGEPPPPPAAAAAAPAAAPAVAPLGAGARLAATYREMWLVLQLPAVRAFALVLLTCKAPLAAFDALVPLELVRAGVPKEKLAGMNTVMLPVSMATQALVSRFFADATPMRFLLLGYRARLAYGGLAIVLVGAIARAAATAPAMLGPLYAAGLLAACWGAAASAGLFVAQMAFFNRVSDPRIGGTYMTMLNTLANLGGQWPGTLVLAAKGAVEMLPGRPNGFYPVAVASLLLGGVWLWLMQGRCEALQERPRADWLAAAADDDKDAAGEGRRRAKRR